MSTMWAAPGREQVFDAVTRTVPPQPVSPFGVQPTLYPMFGVPTVPTPFFGVPPTPYPFFGVSPMPYAPPGYQPITPIYGTHPLAQAMVGAPQITPTFGIQPTMISPIGSLMAPLTPVAHPLAQTMLNVHPLASMAGVQPQMSMAAPFLTHPLAQVMQGIQPLTSMFGIQPTQVPGFGLPGGQIGLQEPLLAALMGTMPAPIPGTIPAAIPAPAPWLHAALAQHLGMQYPHLLGMQQLPGLTHQAAIAAPVAFLLSQISLKEAASKMSDDAMKERLIANINETTNRYIDDIAGVTLHPWFKAGPGAAPWVYPIVSELALIAHRFPEGTIRNEVLHLAGQVLQKSMAPMAGEVGGEGGRRR
jgi:hypothetical protein